MSNPPRGTVTGSPDDPDNTPDPSGDDGGASHAGAGRPDDGTEALATRAAGGDAAALDQLLRAIHPEVLRRCGRFLLFREDAEEAAQDVLLQVHRHIHRFEGRSRFSTWLHTVVANCARQKYRELKRRSAEQPLTPATQENGAPDPRTTSVIAGSRVDILEALDRLERDSPHLVAPLVYRDICGMEYSEIVDRLGIPLGTVKSRLHHARRQLRPWLSSGF
ncbi:RNA polymerase sigma factor [Streptomyces cacaoi]|uniref:RNA polymerase sigma factor n=1 Tax=Streptomyces cacaoi TaxID=1898 RepID=UPI0033296FB7